MNIKLWIIIAMSTLLVENKTDEFTISFDKPNDSFTLKASAIKSTYWNVYIPDEADKNKIIPINYTISKNGVFKTILLNDVRMNEFVEFNNVNWDKINSIKLLKDKGGKIKIKRNEKEKTIRLSSNNSDFFSDNEEVTIKW